MSGVMRIAWALTAFVVVAGIVGWIATGQAVFAVFLVLGVLTAMGAWTTGRTTTAPPSEEGTL